MEPLVSVIIPSYNSAKYIEETVDSVLNQTYKNFEVIVVDDGSTDNTRDILSGKYMGRVTYLFEKNQGTAAARNKGIQIAKGEYIAFLDSDDAWEPLRLERQVDYLSAHQDMGLVYSNAKFVDDDGNDLHCLYVRESEYTIADDEMLKRLILRDHVPFSSLLIRRLVIDDVGVFDLSIICAEDYEFLLRIAKKYHLGYINEILMKYRKAIHSKSQNLFIRHTATIEIINRYIKAIPQSTFLYRMQLQKRLSGCHYGLGYALYERGDFKIARRNFIKSVKYWPFSDWKKYIFILLTSMSPKAIEKIASRLRKGRACRASV